MDRHRGSNYQLFDKWRQRRAALPLGLIIPHKWVGCSFFAQLDQIDLRRSPVVFVICHIPQSGGVVYFTSVYNIFALPVGRSEVLQTNGPVSMCYVTKTENIRDSHF